MNKLQETNNRVQETNNREKSIDIDEATNLVSEAIGDIFVRVGLRSVLGKIWTILYLTEDSLDVQQLRSLLGISTGALNTGLNELIELGFVHRDISKGERRFFYKAETEMWSLVTRIFKERERLKLIEPLKKIKNAKYILKKAKGDAFVSENEHKLERIGQLLNLGSFVVDLLDAFMDRTRVEVKAAQKWLSVSGRIGREPLSRLKRRIKAVIDDKDDKNDKDDNNNGWI